MKIQTRLCVLALEIAIATAGCGKKANLRPPESIDDVVPPQTPGSLESLIGTAWRFDTLGFIVHFSEPPSARFVNPANYSEKGQAYWSYLNDGRLSISALGATFAGTWNGKVTTLSGETGKKVNLAQGAG